MKPQSIDTKTRPETYLVYGRVTTLYEDGAVHVYVEAINEHGYKKRDLQFVPASRVYGEVQQGGFCQITVGPVEETRRAFIDPHSGEYQETFQRAPLEVVPASIVDATALILANEVWGFAIDKGWIEDALRDLYTMRSHDLPEHLQGLTLEEAIEKCLLVEPKPLPEVEQLA